MILTLVLYTLLVSLLLALAARGLEEVFRATGLPTRFVWVAALTGTLTLAALAPFRTGLPEPGASAAGVELMAMSPGEAVAEGADGLAGVMAAARAGIFEVRRAARWPLRAAAASSGGRAARIMTIVWPGLALSLLLVGAGTVLRYRRARRRWPLRDIAGTEVRVAPTAGPAVLGLLRPEIVVPEWLLEKPVSEQRLVALHEREHLRARDGLTLTGGWLCATLVAWNPVLWWMLSRLRLAVELDCDARVLRQGIGARSYGSMLIDMAGRGAGLSLGAPALAGSPSTLERRLTAMTTPFSRLATVRAAGLGVLAGVALLAACDARLPTSAEIDDMDVASAEAQAEQWELTADGGATYFLDGVEVSAEEARAIAPDRIARVEVIRAAGDEGGTIRITSRSSDAVAAPEMVVEGPEGTPDLTIRTRSDVTPPSGFEGLLVIDGIISDPYVDGESRDVIRLRDIQPSQIESVEVIKGAEAARLYDHPRAERGVILVTTKGGSGSG